jgi:hypothetical protein
MEPHFGKTILNKLTLGKKFFFKPAGEFQPNVMQIILA